MEVGAERSLRAGDGVGSSGCRSLTLSRSDYWGTGAGWGQTVLAQPRLKALVAAAAS